VKNPVDLHIGQRVRHRRWLLGMTQQQLALAVGIRFQQIQKYESGANRISASRLWDLARALERSRSFTGWTMDAHTSDLLEERIDHFLTIIRS